MSLYEGLEDDKDKGDSKADLSGWGSMHKMLAIQKQLQAKSKASQMQPKKRGTTMAPVINLRSRDRDRNINTGGELYFNQQTGRLETVGGGGVPTGGTPFIASEAPSASLLGVSDEYDPLRPNDYEDFVKKRKEQKKREEEEKRRDKERERDERRRRDRDRGGDSDEEYDNRRRSKRSRDSDDEEERESRSRRSAGAAIAPPTSLLEEDRFSPERESAEVIEGTDSPPTFQAPGITGASFGMAGSVAAKIMEKLGYKEGSGLGKNQQGMSMALQVEKTSKRGGKIIHEKDILKMEAERPKPEAMTNANLLKNPSKVILLRNMVGPGDVDDDLEPETAEECGKYGKVVKCIIFEIPDEKDPEEAVRIFVEFERMEAAIKAVVDLNGRYFGGRMVKACFYNLDKFRRLDLVDDPN